MQVLGALRNDFLKETLVSPEMYKQGARQWGDPSRLQQFFRKLLRGGLVLRLSSLVHFRDMWGAT